MVSPENRTDLTPFREALVKSPFSYKDYKPIMTFRSNPEIIVRVDYSPSTAEEKNSKHLGTRVAFEQLRSRYGIAVVKHNVVIGPNPDDPDHPIYYTVSERIDGPNLQEKEYLPEEKATAKQKLEQFYSSLTDYVLDTYQNGGWMIDLFHQEARNKQFVYERRKDEMEDKIWLVDVDAKVWLNQNHGYNLGDGLEILVEMIKESEEKLGEKLTNSRQKMIAYLASISEEDSLFIKALYIRRYLQDPTAGSEEEDKLMLKKAVDEFFETPQDLRLTRADYIQCLNEHFRKKPLLKEFQRQWENIQDGDPFQWKWYVYNDIFLFINEVTYALVGRLYDKGKAVFTPLKHRYGNTIPFIAERVESEVGDIIRKTILYGEINNAYLRAKAESDRSVIAEVGWEADIVAHLDEVSGIYEFGRDENGRLLDGYRKYYLQLAFKQQGISYSPLEATEVVEMFHQYAASKKRSPKFTRGNLGRFTYHIVRDHIDRELSDKFAELKQKYGSKNIGGLRQLVEQLEHRRLVGQAFRPR